MRPLRIIFLLLLLVFGLVLFALSELPTSQVYALEELNGEGPAPDPCLPDSWVIVECSDPPNVKCCGSSWSSPCTGPWQRWEWVNCIVRPRYGGEDIICNESTEVTGNCYTTDACYAVSGYPSSNSTGLIWPGKCDAWAGGACHWGPSAYKRCCQGATPKPCSISAPYDYECDQGGGVVWGTVCTAPCTCGSWTNQSCGGWTCADTQRYQTRTCTPSGCDSEDRCVADATCNPGCGCTAWVDQGCGPAGGCAGTEMYQTRTCNPPGCDITTRCASDPGCGGSECSVTCGIPCCPSAWWGGAGDNCGRCGCGPTESAQCNGDGTAWNCVPNPGLCGGEDPQYHKECSGGSCVTVEGAGSDQCSSDAQCRHYYCSGSGISATCKLSITPGSDECDIDMDCQPPKCNGTVINGGADYTNSRNVTLTLNAYNAGEMRLRNQNLAWSGWESYTTVKGWTLSGGADGTRSVTAQYKNDQGTSAIEAACTDSIILDGTPPTSSMTSLPAWSTGTLVALSWSGSDNIAPAGELKYWLQYNIESGSWIDLAGSQTTPTSNTSYDFAGEEGTLYCFRVRARDPAGNWEDWPLTYDTCTSIDAGIEMYGFGWEFGDATPDVWVSVFDGVSGINYNALQCWYSSNGGVSWTARACNYLPTDPTTVSMLNVPFTTQSGTRNKARFRACDVAGSCLTNTYTVDNRTTGAWVQTFGGDIHGNSRIQLREAP